MKVLLLHPEHDSPPERPWNAEALARDLGLNVLFDAMASGDTFIRDVVETVVLCGLADPDAILYRQGVLRDCLLQPALAGELYATAVGAIDAARRSYFGFFSKGSPTGIVSAAKAVLGIYASYLKRLRAIAVANAERVQSAGLRQLFSTVSRELDDTYLAAVEAQLKALGFPGGMLISAELGLGNGGMHYVLRKPNHETRSLFDVVRDGWFSSQTFHLDPRDVAGGRILSDMEGRALNRVANAVAQAADHLRDFFATLRWEMAFYLGCLNLYERLQAMGRHVCFPVPRPADSREHTCRALYDLSLALVTNGQVVGSDLHANQRDLAVITGANRGGKSTFLRSIGLAQLMMQSGMFVAAESFRANICTGLFTHFKREEDPAMAAGKLDEECSRMSQIADHLACNGMVLFNESFAATNEREGSEIARQIVHALLERRVKVFFVTHLHELARGLYEEGRPGALFLRPERKPDGARTFRIIEGEPLQTSYGEDLYRRIFGTPEIPQGGSS